MKIIKKNQLTILVLALMLVTAGYLNYNNNIETSTQVATIGDATLVSSNISNSISNKIENNNISNKAENKEQNEIASSIIENENTVETNSNVSDTTEYFNSSRLERDTMYSQMLESYQKILNNNAISNSQKDAAQKEIDSINKIKNAIMISENLIKTKGINDVVIFVNDDSISVVVNKEELAKEDIAQIQSIIAREMNSEIKDIHITNKAN